METIYEDVDREIPNQHEFRFHQIEKVKSDFLLIIVKRRKLYKNYKKASSTIDWLETSCFIAGATVASIGSVGVVTNVISLPISAICFMLGLTGKIVVPRLRKKAKKHHKILLQTNSSLNSINSLISRAINDEHISASEFELVMKEYGHSQESEMTADSS